MDQQELERLVEQVKQALSDREKPRAASGPAPEERTPPPRLVTEEIVREAAKSGEQVIGIAPGAIVTPLARDALRELGISLASRLPHDPSGRAPQSSPKPSNRTVVSGNAPAAKERIAVGAVPTARALEGVVVEKAREAKLVIVRVPSLVREAAHLARQVAGAVSGGEASLGVIIEETGLVGPAVANRLPGVLAGTCHDPLTARWARERLGANVLCVASELVAPSLMREIAATWFATPAQRPADVAAVTNELDRRQ